MSSEPDYGIFKTSSAEGLPSQQDVPPAGETAGDRASEQPELSIQFDWRKNAILFALTVPSVFLAGAGMDRGTIGWRFALPLLAILITHEFGHYIAARIHGVPASLPYFLPLPFLSPFGTLGAVIFMPKRIRSRTALLDIGAAGPIAGMIVAVPFMIYGLTLSHLGPRFPSDGSPIQQEGQSLLYMALKYAVFGHIPADQDVYIHPTAFAAWAGFFVTFLNMLPFGQLDGGHIAFALFGDRQNRFARLMRFMPLALVVYNFWEYALPVLRRGFVNGWHTLTARDFLPTAVIVQWLILFVLLLVLGRIAGSDHPPVDDRHLSLGRKIVAAGALLMFVAVFVPSPLVTF